MGRSDTFIGEEGPFGSNASGDIHVVDVSDFTAPVEVDSSIFRAPEPTIFGLMNPTRFYMRHSTMRVWWH
jgi:hypothetical protein